MGLLYVFTALEIWCLHYEEEIVNGDTFENQRKHVRTLCGPVAGFLNITALDIWACGDNCSLKRLPR